MNARQNMLADRDDDRDLENSGERALDDGVKVYAGQIGFDFCLRELTKRSARSEER